MMTEDYSPEERAELLALARQTLLAVAAQCPRPKPDLDSLPPKFGEKRAVFVTFHIKGELRGCTGTLQARHSLVEEIIYTTAQTALYDTRFNPVSLDEVPQIRIEISVLTPMIPLEFRTSDELIQRLRPHIDGVFLELGKLRATFLPQVWERIADPVTFLSMLSRKMGLPPAAWREPGIKVYTYQTIAFEEPSLLPT